MFNRKGQDTGYLESESGVADNGSGHAVNQPFETGSGSVIGNDLSITGEQIRIASKGKLTVDGEIDADLHCVDLVVGQQARVTGTIAAENISVFGRVTGTIRGNRVELNSSAVVNGDIYHRKMAMQEGAAFDGRSSMIADGQSVQEAAPQPGDVAQIRPREERVRPREERKLVQVNKSTL